MAATPATPYIFIMLEQYMLYSRVSNSITCVFMSVSVRVSETVSAFSDKEFVNSICIFEIPSSL